MTDKNESGWGKRFFRWVLMSPVTFVFGALMLYYGFRAYVLEADPWRSKVIMIGLAVLWVLWLVFKNLIKFLLLAAVAAAIFYGYYRYENRNEIACRERGGVWDGEKGVCGDKTGWTEKLEGLWKRFTDGKEDEEKETAGGKEE